MFIAVTYLVAQRLSLKALEKDANARFPLSEYAPDFFTNFWAQVLAQIKEISKNTADINHHVDLFKKIQKNFKYSTLYPKKKDGFIITDNTKMLSELVIVFDEASGLLMDVNDSNAYRMLRRSQQRLGSKNCILMFVDTLSTVSSFAPPAVFDPSLRPTQGQDLLPVFYELPTYHKPGLVENELVRKFSYGRPLWWTTFFPDGSPDLLKSALEFARTKMFCGSKEVVENEVLLAVMSLKFGIRGIVDHTLASRLMSSYMATGIYIGPDRLRMVVTYPPEPILAEVASQMLHEGLNGKGIPWDSAHLATKFSKFGEECVNGLVDVGKIGELICRTILSLAFDYCIIKKKVAKQNFDPLVIPFCSAVTVGEFMSTLVASEYSDQLSATFKKEERVGDRIPHERRTETSCY